MKQESFRIINPDTNQVRYVGEKLFNDIDSLKQMGYIQQDLSQGSEGEEPLKKEVDPKELIEEIAPKIASELAKVDPFDPLQLGDKMPDGVPSEEPVVKRKPGRQPKQA